MGTIFLLAAGLWVLGMALGAPLRLRLGMLGALYLAVLLIHILLPVGNSLRLQTGATIAPWLILGAVAALAVGYFYLLGRLRQRAAQRVKDAVTVKPGAFSETELDRYARHIVLREIGGPGQKAMKQARVLVIGAGGLGAPALLYLSAAGVGTIGVIDDDVVDNGNLQRQIIHRDADIGLPKVQSAVAAMKAQNPHVTLRPYQRRLDADIAADLFADYDVILDGSDNADTRYLVNEVATALGKPLVSGALSQWEGQLSVFDPARDAPCYACVFPDPAAAGLAPSCAQAGVIGPLPGVIGSMMALEAIKIVTGAGQAMRGQMLIYDALYGETRQIRLKRDPGCAVCGAGRDASPATADS